RASRIDILLLFSVRIFSIDFRQEIIDMDYLPVQNCSADWDATTDRIFRYADFWHIAPICRSLKAVANHTHDHSVVRIPQPRSILSHHLQNWLHISRRIGNHAQNFACGSLLFQSLGKLAVTGTEFLEQPYVFNGDHGLSGEGFKELDLFI